MIFKGFSCFLGTKICFLHYCTLALTELIRSNGVYLLFSGICRKPGLEKHLKQLYPDEWKRILTVAQYMLTEGNVMYYLPDWQDETLSYEKEGLSDQAISHLFSGIDTEGRMMFFRGWMKEHYKGDYLAYDVTSISCFFILDYIQTNSLF